jgi:hypothetical protein
MAVQARIPLHLITSGTVESAGKQIAGLYIKSVGARWTEQGAFSTAKARAAWLSGHWESLVAQWTTVPLAV